MKIKLGKYITLIDEEITALQKVLKLDPCTVKQRSIWHSMFTDVAVGMAGVIAAVWLVIEINQAGSHQISIAKYSVTNFILYW